MVNFGPLAAEIGPVVWGTPANFNGFRIFAALLHGTHWASAKLCGIEQRALPIFGRAAITLGMGPHSGCSMLYDRNGESTDSVILGVIGVDVSFSALYKFLTTQFDPCKSSSAE